MNGTVKVLDVRHISDSKSAIKAGVGDEVRWAIVSREEGERYAARLAEYLRTSE